jgi:hypothetical protein
MGSVLFSTGLDTLPLKDQTPAGVLVGGPVGGRPRIEGLFMCEKIGVREFRENLTGYLESGRALASTRHSETLGFLFPPRNAAARLRWK